MHHRLQSGMRENPASNRRHDSRLALSGLSHASFTEKETATSPTLACQNHSSTTADSTDNAASNCAATGGTESGVKQNFADGISRTHSQKFDHCFEPLIASPVAAKLLGGIHVKTVQRYARRGKLPGYQIGGHWYFRASELDSWLRSQLNSSRHPCRLSKEAK